jgi:hypothetical protein
MQIKSPPPIFYLAFEALLLVYDRKRFVCSFFFLSCLQRAALLIAVDKLSVTLYENSLHLDSLYTGSFVRGYTIREGRDG